MTRKIYESIKLRSLFGYNSSDAGNLKHKKSDEKTSPFKQIVDSLIPKDDEVGPFTDSLRDVLKRDSK